MGKPMSMRALAKPRPCKRPNENATAQGQVAVKLGWPFSRRKISLAPRSAWPHPCGAAWQPSAGRARLFGQRDRKRDGDGPDANTPRPPRDLGPLQSAALNRQIFAMLLCQPIFDIAPDEISLPNKFGTKRTPEQRATLEANSGQKQRTAIQTSAGPPKSRGLLLCGFRSN